ncbi:hypothetical protein N7492_001988 [Penicillium capsulatum]|uniref:FAD-binding FR-type domain-containing protein n=1 Tax=Penicillium capsulatum TaxID=69766 RepID=A0A9W9LUP4_9EURO|nr:hypothetical protein N7492_001988 [Penicillium capsulatum]KAJ6123392.1 hypothetical protein N7512_005857 [Penicillium capsulatum]
MSSKILRQAHNVWSIKYFAIAVGAMMACFIMYHWLWWCYLRYGTRNQSPSVQWILRFHRATRRSVNHAVSRERVGSIFLYVTYWAINLIVLLTNIDLNLIISVAKRLGWVALCNFVLLVFLSLRNTPLAPLSGYSYEKIRPLHKAAGYTCIFSSVLHGIVYLSAWSELDNLAEMRETENLVGAIAGLAMVIIGVSTITWFARRFYEGTFVQIRLEDLRSENTTVFYVLHVILFMLILILVGMHRPKLSKSTLPIIIFTASMWFSDRLIRFSNLCWNFFGNYATLTPMSDGAVRVTVHRSISARPGSHAFLWIPSIRMLENHPFTLVSTEPAEFLIRQHNGFTNDLYKSAQEYPGWRLRCSVDGGYGQVPDFLQFNRILLVAGGSGASFTFAVALSVLKKSWLLDSSKTVDFIWTVRNAESLKWFEKELQQLQESLYVNLFIYVSRDDAAVDISNQMTTTAIDDLEKGREFGSRLAVSIAHLRKGRPHIASLITDCLSDCPSTDRVGVGACGPEGILDTTRETVFDGSFDKGPFITLHTEEFHW